MRIRVDVEGEDLSRLIAIAVRERRPIPMQAEYMLLKAIREAAPEADGNAAQE